MRALRPHQTKALDHLKASIRSGKRRPLVQAPTGAGKAGGQPAHCQRLQPVARRGDGRSQWRWRTGLVDGVMDSQRLGRRNARAAERCRGGRAVALSLWRQR